MVTNDEHAELLGADPFDLEGLPERQRAELFRRRWGELLEELVRLAEETGRYTEEGEL